MLSDDEDEEESGMSDNMSGSEDEGSEHTADVMSDGGQNEEV